MDLVTDRVDGAVVFNAENVCPGGNGDCGICSDYAVALHNTMLSSGLRYVIIDLQDEKDVCPRFLEEVLQLWKRMRLPFLFTGVMERPKTTLESYSYLTVFPIYSTPEEAVSELKKNYPEQFAAPIDGLAAGSPLNVAKSRLRGEEEGEVEATAAE